MRAIDRELIKAIENQRPLEEIKRIIDEGADVNLGDENGTLLEYLLTLFNNEIMSEVNYLEIKEKNSDFNVDKVIKKQINSIVYIKKIIKLIVKKGIDFEKNEYVIFHSLQLLDDKSKEEITKLLLEQGAKLKNEKDGMNVLMFAIYHNASNEILNLLIQKGAEINTKDKYGLTPLLYAFVLGKKEIYELLKYYDKNSKEENKHILEEILFKKIQSKKNKSENLSELFNYFNIIPFEQILEKALEYGIDINKIIDNECLLSLAIKLEDRELIKFLIEKGADVNIKLNDKTPLLIAWENGNFETVEFLINNGANVKVNINNRTLLEIAEIMQNKKLINLIKNSPTYKKLENNPRKLVKILTNFRKDTPIKFTTHNWEIDTIKRDYGNFDNFMQQVKNQWNKIEKELEELSPHIHEKVKSFLFAENESKPWLSAEGDKLAIGWSNLKDLKDWCNSGRNPFDFKLPKNYIVNNKIISTFGETINLFKREIEIRDEDNYLKKFFISIKKDILKKNKNFRVSLFNLDGKNFILMLNILY